MFRDSIARFRRATSALIAAAALGVMPLGGCGVKGPLKLPPPAPASATPSAATPSAPSAGTPSAPPSVPDSPPDERKP